MKSKDDLLHEELVKKNEMIKMLQGQLRLHEELIQNTNEGLDQEDNKPVPDRHAENQEDVIRKQIETEHGEKMKALQDNLVSRINPL